MKVAIYVYRDDEFVCVDFSHRANKASLTRRINELKRHVPRWYPDCLCCYRFVVFVDNCHYCSVLFDVHNHHSEVFYE